MDAAADMRRDRAAQALVAREREIAVRVVVVDSGAGGRECRRVRPQVGVEVLEAEDLWIGGSVGSVAQAIDADPGNTLEAGDRHRRAQRSVSTASRPCPVPTRVTGTSSASSTKRTYAEAAAGSSVPPSSCSQPGSVSQTGRQ